MKSNPVLLLFVVLLLLVGASACQWEKTYVTDVTELVGVFKQKYAPDRRVAIFDLEVRDDKALTLTGQTNLDQAFQELKDTLDRRQIEFVDSVEVLTPIEALVNVSVCNIRSQPKHSAELSTQSLLGTPIKIWTKQGSWYYVQTPDRYLGWLDAGGLEIPSAALLRQWRESDRLVVSAPFAFITSPLDGSNVSDVVEGNILRLLGKQGNFYQVALPDGRAGLLRRSAATLYEDFVTQEADIEMIVEKAHEFLGRPYLWGGTSGKGMDCSGFTKTVFYLNGLQLPRDASQQVHVGDLVETDAGLSNLERGDLIFFGRPKTEEQKERITHVAIYLGGGKIIHASKRVEIESLRREDPDFAAHRLNTMIRAKRMLVDQPLAGVDRLTDVDVYQMRPSTVLD